MCVYVCVREREREREKTERERERKRDRERERERENFAAQKIVSYDFTIEDINMIISTQTLSIKFIIPEIFSKTFSKVYNHQL